ncbi:MAG: MIP18 family protein [Amphiamblys sp. WSBS2006]|nr:MAG: MIP18 family protein [Amphiamblys sp. WSBS2006]
MKDNPSPTVYSATGRQAVEGTETGPTQVFLFVKDIKDPEHPYTLEELGVVKEEDVSVERGDGYDVATVVFAPTVPHCSLAKIIGLSIKAKLESELPRYKCDVRVKDKTHLEWEAINKQLGDKERVAAAMENEEMVRVLEQLTQSFI